MTNGIVLIAVTIDEAQKILADRGNGTEGKPKELMGDPEELTMQFWEGIVTQNLCRESCRHSGDTP